MRTVTVSEFRAHFFKFLDEIEKGESFLLSRRGKVIARIGPAEQRRG